MQRHNEASSDEEQNETGISTGAGENGSSTVRGLSTTHSRSPTIRSTRSQSTSSRPMLALALNEGRSVGSEIGLAAFDVRHSICHIAQFSDSQTYMRLWQQLHFLEPTDILLPSSMTEPEKESPLYQSILSFYTLNPPLPAIHALARKFFNDVQGLSFYQEWAIQDPLTPLDLTQKYFCLAAVGAVIPFVQETQQLSGWQQGTVRFPWQTWQDCMMMDCWTVQHLKLVQGKDSLLSTLQRPTTSAMGVRLLHRSLLQPLTHLPTLLERQQIVEILLQCPSLYHGLPPLLSSLPDLDALLSSMSQQPRQMTSRHAIQSVHHILLMKHALQIIHELAQCLAPHESRHSLLQSIYSLMKNESFAWMRKEIDEIVDPSVHYQNTTKGQWHLQCHAVKRGYNGLLDVARVTLKETLEDIHALHRSYEMEFNLSLKLMSQKSGIFYFQLSSDEWSQHQEWPPIFIQKKKKKKFIQFTTHALLQLNHRLQSSQTEVALMSDRWIRELTLKLVHHSDAWHQWSRVSEACALLDVFYCFAYFAIQVKGVKPLFIQQVDCFMALKQVKHPIHSHYTANTIFLSSPSLQTLTGPHSSGKSTLLQTLALNQILAQIGCFLPASFAQMRVCHCLSGVWSESISMTPFQIENQSKFYLEMKQLAHVIHAIRFMEQEPLAQRHSLLLLDEIGKSTAMQQGMGFAFASAEYLVHFMASHSSVAVVFVTHFLDVAESLSCCYPCILHLSMKVEEKEAQLHPLYQIQPGMTPHRHYGLSAAHLAQWPTALLVHARTISQSYQEQFQLEKLQKQEKRLVIQFKRWLNQSIESLKCLLVTEEQTASQSVLQLQSELQQDWIQFQELFKKFDLNLNEDEEKKKE